DNGPALRAELDTPDGVAIAPDGDLVVADSHNDRIRRIDRPTGVITTVAGSGENGYDGDDGPATMASLAGPAGIALVSEPDLRLTIFIADYYNGLVRAVGPDLIMRNVSDEGRVAFGAPTRLAFANVGPRRGWLYVADSSNNQIV